MKYNNKIVYDLLLKQLCEFVGDLRYINLLCFHKRHNKIDICYSYPNELDDIHIIRCMCNEFNDIIVAELEDGYYSFYQHELEYYKTKEGQPFIIFYRCEKVDTQYFIYSWVDESDKNYVYLQSHVQPTVDFNKSYLRDYTKDNFKLIDEVL